MGEGRKERRGDTWGPTQTSHVHSLNLAVLQWLDRELSVCVQRTVCIMQNQHDVEFCSATVTRRFSVSQCSRTQDLESHLSLSSALLLA